MIKVVFVDLDGTLINSLETNYLAYKKAFAVFEIDFSRELFLTTWGQDSRDFIPRIAPVLTKKQTLELRKLKSNFFNEFLHLSTINLQLVSVLETLRSESKVVLITTSKKNNANSALDFHGITYLFDSIITGDDVKESKPSPECYLLGLKRIGVLPTEAIAIEDSEAGISAARAAGILTFQVSPFEETQSA